MDTIFMNSEFNKTPCLHALFLDFTDKTNWKRNDKYVALSNLNNYYTWKNMKKSSKNKKFRISARIIFCIRYSRLVWVYLKKHGEKIDNPSIRVYVSKIENRITFEIKTGFYLQLLIPETVKLLGSSKSKITKDENG